MLSAGYQCKSGEQQKAREGVQRGSDEGRLQLCPAANTPVKLVQAGRWRVSGRGKKRPRKHPKQLRDSFHSGVLK